MNTRPYSATCHMLHHLTWQLWNMTHFICLYCIRHHLFPGLLHAAVSHGLVYLHITYPPPPTHVTEHFFFFFTKCLKHQLAITSTTKQRQSDQSSGHLSFGPFVKFRFMECVHVFVVYRAELNTQIGAWFLDRYETRSVAIRTLNGWRPTTSDGGGTNNHSCQFVNFHCSITTTATTGKY